MNNSILNIFSNIIGIIGIVFIGLKVYNFFIPKIKSMYHSSSFSIMYSTNKELTNRKKKELNLSNLYSFDKDEQKFYEQELQKALNELNGKDINTNEKYSTDFLKIRKPKGKFYSTIFNNKKIIVSQEEIYINNGVAPELSTLLCDIFPNYTMSNYISTANDYRKYEIRYQNIVDSYPFVIQRSMKTFMDRGQYHLTDTFIFINNRLSYYMKGSPILFADDISNMITKSKQIEPIWCINELKEKYERDMSMGDLANYIQQPTKNFFKE